MTMGMRFCKKCDKNEYFEIIRMPEGSMHYAKRVCIECGFFFDWMKKPKDPRSQKEAARKIEMKKQEIQLLLEDFRDKFSKRTIELYEMEVDYDYTTENDFWQEDEINLHVVPKA